MKQYKSFMVLTVIPLLGSMSMMALPCTANENVQIAAKTALTNLTTRSLGKLYRMREHTETPEEEEMVVKACVAGLYAIGDEKNALKIKDRLSGDDFMRSFITDCGGCGGEGGKQTPCPMCKGSGKCQNRKCNGGMVPHVGLDKRSAGFGGGRIRTQECAICRGMGKCNNCKGVGLVSSTCKECRGSRVVVKKDQALASCRKLLRGLAVSVEGNPTRKKSAEGVCSNPQDAVRCKNGPNDGSNVVRDPNEKSVFAKAYEKEYLKLPRRQAKISKSEKAKLQLECEPSSLELAMKDERRINCWQQLNSVLGVSFGDEYDGRMSCGSIGDAPVYSFVPPKPFFGFKNFWIRYDHLGEAFSIFASRSFTDGRDADNMYLKILGAVASKFHAKMAVHLPEYGDKRLIIAHELLFINYRTITLSLFKCDNTYEIRLVGYDSVVGTAVSAADRVFDERSAADAL